MKRVHFSISFSDTAPRHLITLLRSGELVLSRPSQVKQLGRKRFRQRSQSIGRRRGRTARAFTAAAGSNFTQSEPAILGETGSLFVFGFGYVALGLATQLRKKGWTVSGTCRDYDKQEELKQKGYDSFIFDSDQLSLGLGKKGMQALRQASHVLVAFNPSSPAGYCPMMWMLGREYACMKQNLRWLGYLSSTSVYGDHQGQWVDEEDELKAVGGKGAARVSSEHAWLYFGDVTGMATHVFRLAGIYGPGRNAIEAAQKASDGKRDGKQFTSRCHVHDICKVLMASMANPLHGEIYNIADDDPSSRETVIRYVKEQLIGSGLLNGESQMVADALTKSKPKYR